MGFSIYQLLSNYSLEIRISIKYQPLQHILRILLSLYHSFPEKSISIPHKKIRFLPAASADLPYDENISAFSSYTIGNKIQEM